MDNQALQQFIRKKENLVGFAILVVGVAALLFVAIFAYQKFFSPATEQEREEIESFRSGNSVNRALGEKTQEEKKSYKRQKSISEKQIAGLWEIKLEKSKVLLEIGKGRYRMVVLSDGLHRNREYSNGTYTIKNDLIMMVPDLNWGPPKDKYTYSLLTRAKMPVIAGKYDGKMIWQVPTKDFKIYVPPNHPILDMMNDKTAVWHSLD